MINIIKKTVKFFYAIVSILLALFLIYLIWYKLFNMLFSDEDFTAFHFICVEIGYTAIVLSALYILHYAFIKEFKKNKEQKITTADLFYIFGSIVTAGLFEYILDYFTITSFLKQSGVFILCIIIIPTVIYCFYRLLIWANK